MSKITMLNEYQIRAIDTAMYPEDMAMPYLGLGLTGEAGEVANKIKKMIRDGVSMEDASEAIQDEMGDVLWYLALLCLETGTTLQDVANRNIEKLAARTAAGTIGGSGDTR